MDSKLILSIVISTYNRCDLLKENLNLMLKCNREDIEFIVSDNNSQDDTWNILQNMKDSRIHIFRNKENLGAINGIASVGYACGTYFTIVNDRDYIKPSNIDRLCEKLNSIENCDVIATFGRKKMNEGFWAPEVFYESFLMCDHPGSLIYNRDFYIRTVGLDTIINKIHTKSLFKPNVEIPYRLLENMNKCYFFPLSIIEQPQSRDFIKQTRTEQYGVAFVLPEYHIAEYDDLAQYALKNKNMPNIKLFLKERYRNALKRVMGDYRQFIDKPGYKERNHIDGQKSEWMFHGLKYAKYVFNNEYTKKLNLRKVIFTVTLHEIILETVRSVRDWVKS